MRHVSEYNFSKVLVKHIIQWSNYAAFQAKLTPGVPVESFIGIRVPVLRKFAKEFTKEAECKEFLQQLPHEYYDENMLHGLLISEVKDYEDGCLVLCHHPCGN